MTMDYDYSDRDLRRQVRAALRHHCETQGITAAEVCKRLGDVPYSTVASWRRVTPSPASAKRILETYSDIIEERIAFASECMRNPSLNERRQPASWDAKIRDRDVANDDRQVIRDSAIDIAEKVFAWTALEPWTNQQFIWKRSRTTWPGDPNQVRALFGLGCGRIDSIEDICEWLGIPVIVTEGQNAVTTLVWVASSGGVTCEIPVIASVGHGSSESIAMELGYLLSPGGARAAAKLAQVTHFADELLAPVAGIQIWLPRDQRRIESYAVKFIAEKFGVGTPVIERQLRRMDFVPLVAGSGVQAKGYLDVIAVAKSWAGVDR